MRLNLSRISAGTSTAETHSSHPPEQRGHRPRQIRRLRRKQTDTAWSHRLALRHPCFAMFAKRTTRYLATVRSHAYCAYHQVCFNARFLKTHVIPAYPHYLCGWFELFPPRIPQLGTVTITPSLGTFTSSTSATIVSTESFSLLIRPLKASSVSITISSQGCTCLAGLCLRQKLKITLTTNPLHNCTPTCFAYDVSLQYQA
jgi:hypothetical protein